MNLSIWTIISALAPVTGIVGIIYRYKRTKYVEDTKVKLAKIEKDKELKLARYSHGNRSVEETELET